MTILRRTVQSSLFLSVSICALLGVGAPAGAVTVGQRCISNSGGPTTQFQSAVSGGNSYVSPMTGVITRWGTDRTTGGDIVTQLITGKNLGLTGWTVFSASGLTETPTGVVTESDVRMPISAGDSIGITYSFGGGSFCSTIDSGNQVDYDSGGGTASPGDSFVGTAATGYLSPVWANVEPDADSDGYGDETQDKCPQSAALQNPCPVLTISHRLAAAKGAISITAAANLDTSLTATASVKVRKLGSRKSATITFASPAIAFAGGQIRLIRLKLPARVTNALAATKKSKKLKFTVTMSGRGLANTASSVKSISLAGTKK